MFSSPQGVDTVQMCYAVTRPDFIERAQWNETLHRKKVRKGKVRMKKQWEQAIYCFHGSE